MNTPLFKRLRAPSLRSLAKLTAPLALSAGLMACDGEVPQTTLDDLPDLVLPRAKLDKQGAAKTLTLSAADASSESEDEGYCLTEWQLVDQTYDEATGEFSSHYHCPEGGLLQDQITEGVQNPDGTGGYTLTLVNRDGTEVVWEYTFFVENGGYTQHLDGSSSEGETHVSEQNYNLDGSVEVDETYGLHEGSYHIDGTYDEVGRFNGTSVFDDPNTEASPDYTLEHHENADGSFQQIYDGVSEGQRNQYDYQLHADGSVDYDFTYDDLATSATPDYDGSYAYGADGSALGGYTQLFDDGSILEVVDEAAAGGPYLQTWSFDDASTEVSPDQEGEMTYAEDGTAAGSVTFHLGEGLSETCALTMDAEGNTDLGECQ